MHGGAGAAAGAREPLEPGRRAAGGQPPHRARAPRPGLRVCARRGVKLRRASKPLSLASWHMQPCMHGGPGAQLAPRRRRAPLPGVRIFVWALGDARLAPPAAGGWPCRLATAASHMRAARPDPRRCVGGELEVRLLFVAPRQYQHCFVLSRGRCPVQAFSGAVSYEAASQHDWTDSARVWAAAPTSMQNCPLCVPRCGRALASV